MYWCQIRQQGQRSEKKALGMLVCIFRVGFLPSQSCQVPDQVKGRRLDMGGAIRTRARARRPRSSGPW